MIYVLTLLTIIIMVVRFDVQGQRRYADAFYQILLVWFIAVSGFAFNVGADIPGYMFEYDEYKWSKIQSLDDILEFRHRQPGWVIVSLLCKFFTSNFLLFKLVEAVFVNVVIFRFIKKYCSYKFTGVLFYAVMLYLNLNFNALRQAYSLGFFLIGFDFLIEKKYVKYYIFVLLALMFHSSAAICLVFPFLQVIKINSKSVIIGVAVIFVVAVFAKSVFMDLSTNLALQLLSSDSSLMEEYGEMGNKFLGDDYVDGTERSLFGYVEMVLQLIFLVVMVLFNIKHSDNLPPIIGTLTILYFAFYFLNAFIPVLFFRLMFYVQVFYFVSLATFCIDFFKVYFQNMRIASTIILIIFFCYTPIKALYAENPRSGMTDLEQFYPYSSVIDKKISPARAAEWGWHK